MNKCRRLVFSITLLLFTGSCHHQAAEGQPTQLVGIAEDLWGNRIDLVDFKRGLTLIEPFSPSNCGYCLLVGEFVELNYFDKNREHGGHNFLQSLFNPQLDVYAYQKYYRDTTTVLTYPLSLFEYHRDGYPALLAFRDGKQILRGFLDDYDKTFKERARAWWPESSDTGVTLASGYKMADNYMTETKHALFVWVFPQGLDSLARKFSKRFEGSKESPTRIVVKCEDQLTPDDLTRNILFQSDGRKFKFRSLLGTETPIRFDSTGFLVGPYRFGLEGTGLQATMPNPYNRECYLSLKLTPGMRLPFQTELQSDFAVWRADSSGRPPRLLIDGRFAKDRQNIWRFTDSLSVVYANLKDYCGTGVCPIPAYLSRPEVHHEVSSIPASWKKGPDASRLTLGSVDCRFPSVAVSPSGEAGIAWEERGDINFVVNKEGEPAHTFRVEDGDPDAYNPRVAYDGHAFLIVYLSNLDNYYHLYGRYLDGDKLSQEFRISDAGAFDDVTPALSSNNAGKIVVAWSQWKANSRYPRYCTIDNRTVGAIADVSTVPDGADMGYVNAWGFSLAIDQQGKSYGMWNQHYPATLCVCGGALNGPVSTPQKLTGNAETSECGEYPSTALDSRGRQWAAWSTFGFRAWRGAPQQVLVARFDSANGAWSTPVTISDDDSTTLLNQTPRLAIGSEGSMAVVWSGRPKSEDGNWGIYLAGFANGRWAKPVLISEQAEVARAPEIAIGTDNKLWIVWHSGVGKGMVIRATVIRL